MRSNDGDEDENEENLFEAAEVNYSVKWVFLVRDDISMDMFGFLVHNAWSLRGITHRMGYHSKYVAENMIFLKLCVILLEFVAALHENNQIAIECVCLADTSKLNTHIHSRVW